jgi:hypothetical protein
MSYNGISRTLDGNRRMKCSELKELLSAYYDGEISVGLGAEATEHLASCAECSKELEAFGQLSSMAKDLETPSPPQELWSRLESQLNAGSRPASYGRTWLGRPLQLAMVAASLVIISGLVWFVGSHDHQNHLAVDFGHYLDRFKDSPTEAQQVLLAKYEGQVVSLDESAKLLGYVPAVASGLPAGLALDAVYVWKMPCCTCVQCLCKRDDGTTIAIFEHSEEQPVWFGDRPATSESCGGKQCSIVQVDDHLAASWQSGTRQITVIGPRDLDELTELVRILDQRRVSAKPAPHNVSDTPRVGMARSGNWLATANLNASLVVLLAPLR